jgi:uncharacterized protein (DUF2126 family)/transglutaminase-like putative cysteine protease
MRVQIENWMRYTYEKAVSFSPHTVRLYPRTDPTIVTHRLQTLANITADVQYRRDLYDNLIANCFFSEPANTLELRIQLEVDLWPKNPFHFLLAPYAIELPFRYTETEARVLAPYLEILPADEVDADEIWRLDGKRSTVDALVDLAQTLHSEIGYEVREDGEARPPSRTLELRSGACRDTALLAASILRKMGLAVRLVSGFLCEFQIDVRARRADSALHAWIEVFLPGGGWVGIDPTNGTFCDHRFIPTAAGVLMADIASVEGSYFGNEKVPSDFDAKLELELIVEKDLDRLAQNVEQTLAAESVTLTMGGEPTFVPEKPEGAEWSVAAVGPTKITYAYQFANTIVESVLPGAIILYTPGKLYPGEIDPRWALNVLQSPQPFPVSTKKETKPPDEKSLKQLRDALIEQLQIEDRWTRASDPREPKKQVWVLPLDFAEGKWRSERWNLRKLELTAANGPAGLRLPLQLLPDNLTKRALVIEVQPTYLDLFLPPLLTSEFESLIRIICAASDRPNVIHWQSYVPVDLPSNWSRIAFTADPGVLEVNLPPCSSWKTYHSWIERLEAIGRQHGLRCFKEDGLTVGTGGGNHLLFGGPSLERNPFFGRPGWVASIGRYWQHHPALSYLFTGIYVGGSAQAPRPDECGHDLLDLELAYRQLESLTPGDQRESIHEILRHLHTDPSGNPHRSEISVDKFWSPPLGSWGLLEFRAIESLPDVRWMSAVALLFRASLAYLLKQPYRSALKQWDQELHDRFFLPTPLWKDLTEVLTELAQFGFSFDPALFREIWDWRFPPILQSEGLAVRKGLEAWPLLADMPIEGQTTSRFVDTSITRLEFSATAQFHRENQVFVNGRELPFRSLSARELIVGLRYRSSALYPSLHPRLLVQTPLILTIFNRDTEKVMAQYILPKNNDRFTKTDQPLFARGGPCEPPAPGLITCDLRIEDSLFEAGGDGPSDRHQSNWDESS